MICWSKARFLRLESRTNAFLVTKSPMYKVRYRRGEDGSSNGYRIEYATHFFSTNKCVQGRGVKNSPPPPKKNGGHTLYMAPKINKRPAPYKNVLGGKMLKIARVSFGTLQYL